MLSLLFLFFFIASSRREVINSSVQNDVASIFKDKTYSQLGVMQKQIKAKVKAGGSIDVGKKTCLHLF